MGKCNYNNTLKKIFRDQGICVYVNCNKINDELFCKYILQRTGKTHGNDKFQVLLIDLLNNKQLILCMKIYHGRTYLPFHITIHLPRP